VSPRRTTRETDLGKRRSCTRFLYQGKECVELGLEKQVKYQVFRLMVAEREGDPSPILKPF
jgi:hypothetical protein